MGNAFADTGKALYSYLSYLNHTCTEAELMLNFIETHIANTIKDALPICLKKFVEKNSRATAIQNTELKLKFT